MDPQPHMANGRYAYVYRNGQFHSKIELGPEGQFKAPYQAESGDVVYVPVLVMNPSTVMTVRSISNPQDPPTVSGTEVTKPL